MLLLFTTVLYFVVIGFLCMAYPDGCCILPPMIWLISKVLILHVRSQAFVLKLWPSGTCLL